MLKLNNNNNKKILVIEKKPIYTKGKIAVVISCWFSNEVIIILILSFEFINFLY